MKNEENFFDLIQGGFQAILLSKKKQNAKKHS